MGNFKSVSLMPSEARPGFFSLLPNICSRGASNEREGNEIWGFKEAGSKQEGRGGNITQLEDGGLKMRMRWNEMDQKKKKQNNTSQEWRRKKIAVHFQEGGLVKWRGCTVGAAPLSSFLCSGSRNGTCSKESGLVRLSLQTTGSTTQGERKA